MTLTPRKSGKPVLVSTDKAGERLFASLASKEAGRIVYGVRPQWVRQLIADGRLSAERYPPEAKHAFISTLLVPEKAIKKYNDREIAAFRKWMEGQGKTLPPDDPSPLEQAS